MPARCFFLAIARRCYHFAKPAAVRAFWPLAGARLIALFIAKFLSQINFRCKQRVNMIEASTNGGYGNELALLCRTRTGPSRGGNRVLEKARKEFVHHTAVCDPAYWRLRLDTIRERLDEDPTLERQMSELLARIDRLEARNPRRESADFLA
ncbi:hypothetical protein BMMON3_33740 [Burkholderia mallei]